MNKQRSWSDKAFETENRSIIGPHKEGNSPSRT